MSKRQWYQGLTHDISGNFSLKTTIVSASIITAIAGIGHLLDKEREKGRWQTLEEKRTLASITSKTTNR